MLTHHTPILHLGSNQIRWGYYKAVVESFGRAVGFGEKDVQGSSC